MNHPFKIGETYENAKGSYTVLSISLPKMEIQHEDGSQSMADVAIQTRIWERIEDERAMAREESERRAQIYRPPIAFSGLMDGDFKGNVSGTNWRSREGLAGLVSKRLSEMSGFEYTSGAIYRRPQFFVYPPHLPMFNQAEGVKLPKFVVQLHSAGVLYGFYIEKSDKEMDRAWYWPRFIDLLSDAKWQDFITQAMSDLGLSWIMRFEEQIPGTEQYTLAPDIVISSFGESSRFATASDFFAHLDELPKDQWCNLFFAKTMDKPEAIDLKEKVSQPISQTLNRLAPLYSRLLVR